jgi:prepilin peptidase CpaA
MNLVQLAPLWLVALFCAALIAAALEDVLRLRVSNIIVLAVIATAGVAVGLAGWSPALWQNLLVFIVLLAGGTLLFASGMVGGADVKLLAAVGLWMDLERALILLPAVFISGGVLALFALLPRLLLRRANGLPLRERTKGVPYAVAIAVGALLVIAFQRQEAAARHPNPLKFHAPVAAVFLTLEIERV